VGYIVIMSDTSIQRSFRLSATTSTLLDSLAATSTESRNSLVDRLLGEALRTQRHPLIGFRTGAAGRREPCLVGTRLLVRQVVASVKAERDGDRIRIVADDLDLDLAHVRAAVDYYADFTEEIEADIAWARAVEDEQFTRWERQQAALR